MCMGRTHFMTGAAAGAVASTALPLVGIADGRLMMTACALVAGGCALLPDLDQTSSTAAYALGPLTRGFPPNSFWGTLLGAFFAPIGWMWRLARGKPRKPHRGIPGLAHFVAWVSGGHRHGTHSLLGLGLLGLGVTAIVTAGQALAVGALIVLAAGLGLRGLLNSLPRTWYTHGISTFLFCMLALAVCSAPLMFHPWLVPPLYVLGALVHILGDQMTKGGVPWLYPRRRWYKLEPAPFGVTGEKNPRERWLAFWPAVVTIVVMETHSAGAIPGTFAAMLRSFMHVIG